LSNRGNLHQTRGLASSPHRWLIVRIVSTSGSAAVFRSVASAATRRSFFGPQRHACRRVYGAALD
jgi:hypothetical protein